MKKMSFTVALVAVLAVGLCGCGGGASEADYSKNFAGNWELVRIDATDNAADADTIELMKTLGLTCTLVLGEDNSATLNLFDDEQVGTWEVVDAESMTLTLAGSDITGRLQGEELLLESGSGEDGMVFKPATAESTANANAAGSSDAQPEGTDESATEDMAEEQVAEDDSTEAEGESEGKAEAA